jgi:glutamate/aspartate transport system substrate-binding protein
MKSLFVRVIAVVLFAASFVAVAAVADAGTLDQIKQSGKIRIGYRVSEPPMSFVDQNGNPVGYSIDLCSRIVTEVKTKLGNPNISVEYVAVDSATRLPMLADNSIDILCGATTKTLSRGEIVDFTELTFVTGASLLSLKSAPVAGVADLQGKKVAVVKDTTTIDALEGALKQALIEAQVVPVASAAEGFAALQNGQVNAFSSDQVVLIGLLLTSANRDNFVISNELFSYEPFALAVRRNDADFRLVADRVLSHLYRTGEVVQIYEKWFGEIKGRMPSALQAMYQLSATPE